MASPYLADEINAILPRQLTCLQIKRERPAIAAMLFT